MLRMSRIVAAVVLVVVGVILFFTAGSIVGAIVGMVGFAVFGWAMTRPSSTALVGQKCKQCGDGIFIEGHADRCSTCQAPLHARCMDAHVKTH
jgi:hypothetical protein